MGTGKRTKTHQYSVTEYDNVVHKGQMQMPSVLFIYDLSPISVTITETRTSFAHLLVRVCAVVGGVFAVTGMPLCWPTLVQNQCHLYSPFKAMAAASDRRTSLRVQGACDVNNGCTALMECAVLLYMHLELFQPVQVCWTDGCTKL